MGPNDRLIFNGFRVCLPYPVIFLLLQLRTGELLVIGPSQPIVAMIGDDVTLLCHMEPVVDASDLRLEWARPDLTPGYIYVQDKRKEDTSKQQPSFRGRASVSMDGLKHGNVSLVLSNVTLSDAGTYRCLLPTVGQPAFNKLVVGAVCSPVISSLNRYSTSVDLQCVCNGSYPEPELSWSDSEGQILPVGHTETVSGSDGLYSVSSRVTVKRTHSNNFTCRITQRGIHQTRETHFYISALSPYLKIILLLGLLAVVFAGYLLCRKKFTPRKKMDDDEAQRDDHVRIKTDPT